jgi:hypothetical protein
MGSTYLRPYQERILTRTMAGKRNYGWAIFGLSFTNLLVEGGIKKTVPVVYVALRDSFHWSAAATSGIFSLGGLIGALRFLAPNGSPFGLKGSTPDRAFEGDDVGSLMAPCPDTPSTGP